MLPQLEHIDHIHVFTADRSLSEAWYAKVLGLTRLAELEFWSDGGGPLTISNASGTVHLALFEGPAQRCRSTIALKAGADEFLVWCRHLTIVLGRPIEPIDHAVSWSVYFDDPDHNPFEITSYEHASIAAALGKSSG